MRQTKPPRVDFSQTFETVEEAICLHKKRGLFSEGLAKPAYSRDLQEHFDEIDGEKSIYASGYVCEDCGKPTAFYVQVCWGCPEDKELFYGRPGTTLCKEHKEEERNSVNVGRSYK